MKWRLAAPPKVSAAQVIWCSLHATVRHCLYSFEHELVLMLCWCATTRHLGSAQEQIESTLPAM